MDWVNLKSITGVIGAAVAGALCNILGGWDVWLKALVLFVILDYFSGVMAAFYEKKLSSEISYKGIVKKVFIFVLVAVAFEVDVLAGTNAVRYAVIGFYVATEGLSILENAGRSGLPLPEILLDALERMKEQKTGKQEVKHE